MPRSNISRGRRRQTVWRTFDPSANTITAGTTEATQAFALQLGETIVRIHGTINWHGLTVDTASAYYVGIGLFPSTIDSDDLDPDAAPSLDWMFWMGDGSRNPAYDGVDSFVEQRHMIDVHGRRRADEGLVCFVSENCAGTNVVSYIKLRALIMLP